jgi:hypothetical protein
MRIESAIVSRNVNFPGATFSQVVSCEHVILEPANV